jgi:hypothetical protein
VSALALHREPLTAHRPHANTPKVGNVCVDRGHSTNATLTDAAITIICAHAFPLLSAYPSLHNLGRLI